MKDVTLTIWGKVFSLDVKYEHYDDEIIPESMQEALHLFLQSPESIEDSLPFLKDYCRKQNHHDIVSTLGSDELEDIFSVAIPISILVLSSDEEHKVSLMLDYRFDMEEGIGMLFTDEKLSFIGTQSSVYLT